MSHFTVFGGKLLFQILAFTWNRTNSDPWLIFTNLYLMSLLSQKVKRVVVVVSGESRFFSNSDRGSRYLPIFASIICQYLVITNKKLKASKILRSWKKGSQNQHHRYHYHPPEQLKCQHHHQQNWNQTHMLCYAMLCYVIVIYSLISLELLS